VWFLFGGSAKFIQALSRQLQPLQLDFKGVQRNFEVDEE